MRVLIFGFSVTADKAGYADSLAKMLRSRGDTEVDICGIGGCHPNDVAFLLERILPPHRYDLVILDIITSSFRNGRTTCADFGPYISVIVHKILVRGAVPVFLHLYRSDVDPQADLLTEVCDRIAGRLGFPTINLAREIIRSHRPEDLFKDVVHPNARGHRLYAELAAEQIEHVAVEGAAALLRADNQLAGSCGSLLVHEIAADLPSSSFERTGLVVPCVDIEGGATVDLDLGRSCHVAGLAYLMGPRTSEITIADESARRLVSCYDQHCYYERFAASTFESFATRHLSVTVSDQVPKTPLLKGEKDTGPRIGKLTHLLTCERPWTDIVEASRRLWEKE